MIEIFLAIAPILLILCLSGYGAALCILLDWKRSREIAQNIFESAFFGIFLVTGGVLLANFFVGLGTDPGPYVLGIGLALFVVLQWRIFFQSNQFLLLLIVVNVISRFAWTGTYPSFDAGLYHIPTMNWVAYQPVPLGLAKFYGPLGLNSAWLLFQSAFRAEKDLQWSHLAIAEMAIRSLVVAWISNRFLTEVTTSGWHAKSIAYLAAIVVILAIISTLCCTSTDHSANLLAFCAWVVFCNLMLMDESERRVGGATELSLLLVLITLAVTFKVMVLPIVLLPVLFFLWMDRHEMHFLILSQRGISSILVVYSALWVVRDFMLTGCIVYPVDLTCAPVPWGVGAANAKLFASWSTAWARAQWAGDHALDYLGVFNVTWIPSWFAEFRHFMGFKLVVAAAAFVFVSFVFVKRRDQVHCHADISRLVWASIVCATIGVIFWFVNAPHPRYSWSFFAILAATLLFVGLHEFDYTPPKIGIVAANTGKRLNCSILLGVAATLALAHVHLVPLVAPIPPSKTVTVSGGWHIYMTSGGPCWALFPCTPYDFGTNSVEDWNGRLLFRSRTQ